MLVSADSLPGQDITARVTVESCHDTQLNVGANLTYMDPQGNPVEQSPETPVTVTVETSSPTVEAGPAVSFIAPADSSPVYFTVARSFYMGASLAGKRVKLAGRISLINSIYYVDDGSTLLSIDPVTGRRKASALLVPVRTDLLTGMPQTGTPTVIQGVCRLESDGRLSLLPLSDISVALLQ